MNTILVFLLILVVLILFKTRNLSTFTYDNISIDELVKKLYNGSNLNGYRLADVIFYPDYLSLNHIYSTASHLYTYPGTIGVEYIKRKYPILKKINSKKDFEIYKNEYSDFERKIKQNLKDEKIDINLLNQIINEQNKTTDYVDPNSLYLHVRVGDVLCKYPNSNHSLIYSKKGDTVWWDNVISFIKSNNITTVIIIAGTHFEDCLKESAKYIVEIADLLKKNSLNVFYRIGNSPDNDLIFCKNAKYFITTGGGYGYFLGKIVQLNGGTFALNKKDTVRKDRQIFDN